MVHPNTQDSDPFSLHSVFLRMLYQNEAVATGTGLLARTVDHRIYLITALHNLTGREPDGRTKDNSGAWPNFLEIKGNFIEQHLPLYADENDPSHSNPLFFRHPDGPIIDICALPIAATAFPGLPLDASFLDPLSHAATVRLYVTQLCFIVGYPEGLFSQRSETSIVPIWKTGHIASEPAFYIDGQPKILIDAATCKGLSGSPVYVRELGRHRLLGIYTGRTVISELGFVFTPEAILQLLDSNK